MNEKATNLNPDIPTAKRPGNYENDFNEQFYIAEGSAGLLFHVVANKELDGINDSVIASATYATQKAVGEMSEVFEGLLDYSAQLQQKLQIFVTDPVAGFAIVANADDGTVDDVAPNIKKHGAEGEFNHQHLIAEGTAGLLFEASADQLGSMDNAVINSAAYTIQSAVSEMNKCFQAQLTLDNKETRGDL